MLIYYFKKAIALISPGRCRRSVAPLNSHTIRQCLRLPAGDDNLYQIAISICTLLFGAGAAAPMPQKAPPQRALIGVVAMHACIRAIPAVYFPFVHSERRKHYTRGEKSPIAKATPPYSSPILSLFISAFTARYLRILKRYCDLLFTQQRAYHYY